MVFKVAFDFGPHLNIVHLPGVDAWEAKPPLSPFFPFPLGLVSIEKWSRMTSPARTPHSSGSDTYVEKVLRGIECMAEMVS